MYRQALLNLETAQEEILLVTSLLKATKAAIKSKAIAIMEVEETA
jgi:hypothetical protein